MSKWKLIEIHGDGTNYEVSTSGEVRNSFTKKLLKQELSNSGYYRVTLYINGKPKKFSVHRLVAVAFVPIGKKYIKQGLSYDDLVPDHRNFDKTDNRPKNLKWITQKENTTNAFDALVGPVGEKSHLAKMTDSIAIQCCELLSEGVSSGEIASKLGISKKSVNHIKFRETWTRISKNYTFPISDNKPYQKSDSDIHEICKLIENKIPDSAIANQFGVSREYVRDIRMHKRRTNISKHYNF